MLASLPSCDIAFSRARTTVRVLPKSTMRSTSSGSPAGSFQTMVNENSMSTFGSWREGREMLNVFRREFGGVAGGVRGGVFRVAGAVGKLAFRLVGGAAAHRAEVALDRNPEARLTITGGEAAAHPGAIQVAPGGFFRRAHAAQLGEFCQQRGRKRHEGIVMPAVGENGDDDGFRFRAGGGGVAHRWLPDSLLTNVRIGLGKREAKLVNADTGILSG